MPIGKAKYGRVVIFLLDLDMEWKTTEGGRFNPSRMRLTLNGLNFYRYQGIPRKE
jgi:hypothetical protein